MNEENKTVFLTNKKLKHSKTHRALEPLVYQEYPLNEKLCIVNAVQCYLSMRENLVDANTKEFVIINGVNITDILKRGCWKRQNTITKFYSKDFINKENSKEDLDYSKLLLEK